MPLGLSLALKHVKPAVALVSCLQWQALESLAAASRSAAPPEILLWVKKGFVAEAHMRRRLPFLRRQADLQTTLSIVASGLGLWRDVVAKCGRNAFEHVRNDAAEMVAFVSPELCADVALYYGALLCPAAARNVGCAIVAHALALSSVDEEAAAFHSLAAAMITLVHQSPS